MLIYVVFHGPILANFFFLKNIYIRDVKSNEKPLRAILLNLDGFSTFTDWSTTVKLGHVGVGLNIAQNLSSST